MSQGKRMRQGVIGARKLGGGGRQRDGARQKRLVKGVATLLNTVMLQEKKRGNYTTASSTLAASAFCLLFLLASMVDDLVDEVSRCLVEVRADLRWLRYLLV